jgi:hypothetical protein
MAINSKDKQKSSSIEFMFRYADGRRLTGRYHEYDGMVRVITAHGTKATQLGGSPGDSLARLLAKELADEFQRQQDSPPNPHVLTQPPGVFIIKTGVPRRGDATPDYIVLRV